MSSESEKGVRKLVSVWATFTSITETRVEAVGITKTVGTAKAIETNKVGEEGEKSKSKYSSLIQVSCIRYHIYFWKKSVSVSALFVWDSKINAIYLAFAWELQLPIRLTNAGAQKIDGTMLDTFGMVVTAFSMTDKANRVRFLKETFLVANVSLEVVFEMLFLILSSSYVDFLGWKLGWRIYTIKETLPTTEPVGKKEFAVKALDLEYEIYVVQVGSVSSNALPDSSPFDVHPS